MTFARGLLLFTIRELPLALVRLRLAVSVTNASLHSDYFVAYWVVTGLLRVFYVRVRGVNPLAEAAPHTKRPFQVALG